MEFFLPPRQISKIKSYPLAYRRQGQGPPLIFLHGHRADTEKWWAMIARAAEDFTVYAPELPGMNPYSPPLRGEETHLEDYADLIAAWIEKMQLKKPLLLGVSFGGLVALILSRKKPQLIRGQVLFWTPLSGKFFHDPRLSPRLRAIIHQLARGGLLFHLWRFFVASPLLYFFLRRDIPPQEFKPTIIKHELAQWRGVDLLSWARTLDEILRLDLPPSLTIISPTLLVLSPQDRYFDYQKTMKLARQVFSTLEIITINQPGHVPKGILPSSFVLPYEKVFAKIKNWPH